MSRVRSEQNLKGNGKRLLLRHPAGDYADNEPKIKAMIDPIVNPMTRPLQLHALLGLLLLCGRVAAQTANSPTGCGTPEAVMRHYVEAVGGEAAIGQVQSLLIEARDAEPHSFSPSMRYSRYQFKWKSPNKVASREWYVLSRTTWLFDGSRWSGPNGRVSRNEDKTPEWRKNRQALHPYNDLGEFIEFRVLANPIVLATDKDLYSGFESLPGAPGECLLEAKGLTEWRTERRDQLTLEAATGYLKSWKIQSGLPNDISIVEFLFADYRQSGPVRIPWSIYFDLYRANFTLTKVVFNPSLSDEEFQPRN